MENYTSNEIKKLKIGDKLKVKKNVSAKFLDYYNPQIEIETGTIVKIVKAELNKFCDWYLMEEINEKFRISSFDGGTVRINEFFELINVKEKNDEKN